VERKVRIWYNKGMKKQLDSIQCPEKNISTYNNLELFWSNVGNIAMELELEEVFKSIIFESNDEI